ncbi:hypothetical protein EHI42_23565 [Rhizobium hidalgonense]|nr:hypothetical protein EHI42_23565 [Rhizobium hidalgonense]
MTENWRDVGTPSRRWKRTEVCERTNQIAQDSLAEERQRREAKTERLREARLQAGNYCRRSSRNWRHVSVSSSW